MRPTLPYIILFILFALVQYHPARAQQTVECGDIIESEFTELQENQDYAIVISAGDSLSLFARPLGTDLELLIQLYNPTNTFVAGPSGYYGTFSEYQLDSGILGANGDYKIRVANHDWTDSNSGSGGVGVFILEIGCTLRTGRLIEPGSSLEAVAQQASGVSEQPLFSGYGFPGVMSVDFSSGIEIPLAAGQPQTIPVGSDVALYTYEATAGQVTTLRVSRFSGDISIGVAVINRDSNEIIFFGGLPSSNNLNVELTFPSSEIYVIGLFRVDTAEHPGTSGAVQITLE